MQFLGNQVILGALFPNPSTDVAGTFPVSRTQAFSSVCPWLASVPGRVGIIDSSVLTKKLWRLRNKQGNFYFHLSLHLLWLGRLSSQSFQCLRTVSHPIIPRPSQSALGSGGGCLKPASSSSAWDSSSLTPCCSQARPEDSSWPFSAPSKVRIP